MYGYKFAILDEHGYVEFYGQTPLMTRDRAETLVRQILAAWKAANPDREFYFDLEAPFA